MRKRKCRNKKCSNDKGFFRPEEGTPDYVKWCSESCKKAIIAKALAKEQEKRKRAQERAKKVQKKKDKTRLNELKPISHWLTETQKVFNEFIKFKQAGQPCISCGTTRNIQYCAGHYRTRGAAGHLRFDERNVHRQCNKRCNLELSGNIANYRPRLIEKIGLEAVEALENDNKPKSWTREELEEIRKVYRAKCKELENGR